MQVMRATKLSLLTLALAAATGCGWFASAPTSTEGGAEGTPSAEGDQNPEPEMPLCRPADAMPEKAAPPWTEGESTASGWAVTDVTFQEVSDPAHWPEFVRISLAKDGVATALEIAFSDGTVGDWSTPHYRLMPAPDMEPPEEVLNEAMATLRAYDEANPAKLFVSKREGVTDPYDGLPPCGPDGKPI